MKRTFAFICFFLCLNIVQADTFEIKGNPIITDRFTADPAALVVGDTVYLYVGHDEAKEGEMFNIKEWLCYGTIPYIEQTKAGITVPPKTAEEVAQIKNPYADRPSEVGILGKKTYMFEATPSKPKSLGDDDFSTPAGFDTRKFGVEYGEIKTITYFSTTTENDRKATIILPPNFDESKKYPVLYLLHGIGGNEREWLGGNPNEVINNLVTEGKTKEMLVVIPNIRARHKDAGETEGFSPARFREFDNFLNDMRDDLMPYIEKNYPVLSGRDNRAVAGLSMGGRSALHVGINFIDLFAYIGAFTPAPGVLPGPRGEGLFTKETLTLPREYSGNKENRRNTINTLIMITKGSTDGVVGNNPTDYSNALKENEIEHIYTITEGGHDFNVWKVDLYNFAKRIFQ